MLAYADLARPRSRALALGYDTLLVVFGSIVVALAAQVAVPLPFTPVPWTLQPLAVLLVGALLGARRGALALLAYLGEGLAGAPVFAGGAFGPLVLAGPTGGYLVGFVPAAFVTGFLAERGWDRRFATTWAAMALGSATLFVFGLAWLSRFVGWQAAVAAGLLPFLPGDLLKQVLGRTPSPDSLATAPALETDPFRGPEAPRRFRAICLCPCNLSNSRIVP